MSDSITSPTFVYFISDGFGPIKIGVADIPQSRLFNMQTAHYKRLHLLFTIQCPTREQAFQLESVLHRLYDSARLLNEWFNISPVQIEQDLKLFTGVEFRCHTPVQEIENLNSIALDKRLRKPVQLDKAIEWLIANPGHLDTASRELVERVGVSHVTIYKAQQIIKANDSYTNGRAH